MDTNEIQQYIEDNFSIDGGARRIVNNILCYMEGHTKKERYEFFKAMLDGIGLTDNEIKKFS